MIRQQTGPTALAEADLAALGSAAELVRTSGTVSRMLRTLAPALGEAERESLAAWCVPAHAAVLVFPTAPGQLAGALAGMGLAASGPPTPSTVVRDRLRARYGIRPDALEVSIVRAAVPTEDGGLGEVEVFSLPVPPTAGPGPGPGSPGRFGADTGACLRHLVRRERAERNEAHVAFRVTAADEVVFAGLRFLLVERAGMRPDGGGYNPHEDVTVLYFRSAAPAGTPYARLELLMPGHRTSALAAHRLVERDEPGRTLLELMTGAWRTQAIAVAAELGVFDALSPDAGGPAAVADLAARVGADPDGLDRLLRYLATLGLLAGPYGPGADTYAPTGLGELLRADAPHSMRPLALMYGGPFYESFGQLLYAVRTGGDAFAHHFGAHHFPYFAEHPPWDTAFDQSMQASSLMFGPIPAVVDRPGVDVVVDVAGGNGELMKQILAAAPRLRGVLLEREHVVAAARGRLREAGVADRCTFRVGDFTEAVPGGGDVYVLSRVLHDWDDRGCADILRRCAEAMPEEAELLVVERLLPPDGQNSLAVAWNLHMLCNVGGRERTLEHYRRLLAEAGFDLVETAPLPLDGSLLRARRKGAAAPAFPVPSRSELA
ncbi:methyltransferase [Streptomyces sp. 2P-4]|uniref:methyltransferase n=1 Tax=Streptomyces sp. 2P-4 TaxID=2931974 RepID=UPI00253FD32C|nr:methyltransferase [Streptomyces sp. 2P-4]